jgi:glycosyltransferase involved in cell wall biosynthesis
MVVAEALAHQVPVIASRGTPWQRLTDMQCGLWVDNTPEALAEAVKRIAAMPLHSMGDRGRLWMQREFSWDQVAVEMRELYADLVAARRGQ